MAADTVDLSSEIPAALSGDRLVRSPSGVLGAAAPVRDRVTLVTGVWLNPSYWEQLGQVREARENYARVGVLVDVARERVWLTVAALALVISLAALFLARALAEGMTNPLARLASAIQHDNVVKVRELGFCGRQRRHQHDDVAKRPQKNAAVVQ